MIVWPQWYKLPLVLVVGLFLVAWAYWPGLQGPQLLDDFSNLAVLEKLELNGDFSTDVVTGNTSGPLGRPISMASFVLESLYLDYGVPGQKRIGLLLHLINGCLVFLLCLRLLRASRVSEAVWLAGLTAGLWLSAPLLLSTTLYVVQRMTLLAAMFSLVALCSYCFARDRGLEGKASFGWWLLALVSTVCSILSKENGVLTLPMMTAIEAFVYGFHSRKPKLGRELKCGHGLVLLVPCLAAIAVVALAPERILGGYAIRDFSLVERLLTEPRILWDYVRQLVWPQVQLLGLYHDDVELSRSLLQPISTLWSVLGWVLVAVGCAGSLIWRRGRLFAFGCSFFLIGHALESTVVSLELYFEHRNYLPSVGIWFALVVGLGSLQSRWPILRGWLLMLLLLVLVRNWLLLGSQAVVWSDTRLLHIDAVNHHPHSARALLELAQVYALDGNLNGAIELMERAPLAATDSIEPALLRVIFHCLAGVAPPAEMLDEVQATRLELSDRQIGQHIYHLTGMLINNECAEADVAGIADQLDMILRSDGQVRGTRKIYAAMILLENHLQRYERGMEYVGLLLHKEPDSVMGLQFMLYFSSILGMEESRDAAQEKLRALQEAGSLNVEETYNFELFVEE